MKRRGILAGFAYGLILTAFTAFLLLDTFVISRAYSQVEESRNARDEAPMTLVETLHEYDDGQIRITISAYRGFDSYIYAAEIQLSSPARLQTALAEDTYGKNVKELPSVMAERHQAILAINGDYYGAQEHGYVLRNGAIYRTSCVKGQEDLIIYQDGSFGIVKEELAAPQELLDAGAVQVLSFGPALVEHGEISVAQNELRGKDKTRNPRTAIGYVGDLKYLFVVADGRTDESDGLTVPELAEVMCALSAQTAYNLDGGGSSCMYFDGKIVNMPTTRGDGMKEREVSDIVFIGY